MYPFDINGNILLFCYRIVKKKKNPIQIVVVKVIVNEKIFDCVYDKKIQPKFC